MPQPSIIYPPNKDYILSGNIPEEGSAVTIYDRNGNLFSGMLCLFFLCSGCEYYSKLA